MKQKLLSLGVFKDNEYLDKYVNLITNNKQTKKEKFITECHHIIPRVYYKSTKQRIDNSAENLVHLKYCDHVLAHCLLALSFDDTYLVSASVDSVYAVLNSFDIYSSLEEFVSEYKEVKDVLICNHYVSKDQKDKLSAISSNSRWYNNGVRETFNRVCPEGWVPGRLPVSAEVSEKVRKRSSKCRWYNNGTKCTFAEHCPDGWVPGRIMTPKLLESQKRNAESAAKKNRIPGSEDKYKPKTTARWYTDGTVERKYHENPGFPWVPGRLEATKINISKGKKTDD